MDDRLDLIDDLPGGIQGKGRKPGHFEAIPERRPAFLIHGGGVISVEALRGKQVIGG